MTWVTAPLGKVARIERNSVAPTEILSGSRYVGLEHIESGGASVSFEKVSNGQLTSNKFQFGPQHILYGKLRPYLAKIACPNFNGICSTDILPIAVSQQIDQRYLFHFLRHPRNVAWASSRATGVNLPRLSPRELEALQVPLPPLNEQRRIATILDKADGLCRKRKRAFRLIEGLTSSLAAKHLNSSALIELGEIISEGPTNGLYKPTSAYGDGAPIVRINNFYDGKIIDIHSLKRLRVDRDELSRFRLAAGDILVNRVNSLEYLGKSALVPRLPETTVYESNMMRLSVDESRMLPEVCVALLQTPSIKKQILRKAKNAVNQSSINQQDVRSLLLPLPTMAHQQKFLAAHGKLAALEDSMLSQDVLIGELFYSLQHRAFSGRL